MELKERIQTYIKICQNHSFEIHEFMVNGNGDIWLLIYKEYGLLHTDRLLNSDFKFNTLLGDEIEIKINNNDICEIWKLNGKNVTTYYKI